MSVRMRNHTILGVNRGCDVSSEMAVEIANAVHKKSGGYSWHTAIVDREDGLCLLYGHPHEPLYGPKDLRGFHFNAARAGYSGAGVAASATILELFGFGPYREIYDKISAGGDQAFHVFGPYEITELLQ